MKYKLLFLSLLPLASVFSFLIPSLTPFAKAGCVATSIGVQLDINGSKKPGQQVNNVNQDFGEDCFGNSVTSTATQVNVGSEPAQQIRNNNQHVTSPKNPTGVKTPNVGVKVHVPVRVYSPAHDPNFLKKK